MCELMLQQSLTWPLAAVSFMAFVDGVRAVCLSRCSDDFDPEARAHKTFLWFGPEFERMRSQGSSGCDASVDFVILLRQMFFVVSVPTVVAYR